MILLAALLAAAAPADCAGIVLRDRGRATCVTAPPLVPVCRALRSCARRGACVVTVTGRITAQSYADDEAWGDWLDRLRNAPPNVVAATRESVAGGPRLSPPYTVIVVPDRSPRVAPGLWLDDLAWLAGYAGRATPPDGLALAPRGLVARLCPGKR